MLNKLLNKFFNSSNQKEIKKYKKQSQEILEKEKYYQQFSNEIIKRHFIELKEEVLFNNKTLDDIKLNIFAIVREMAKRLLNMKHFEVQLIGGLVLHDGKIAEMKTGEGKTLVATLPTVLNAINKQVHIVTVNDYLATRDAKEFEPLYNFFDMTVGINTSNNPLDKKEIYKCNIIYGTNSEFGFDYLRDNLKTNENEFLQKKHEFVIIDEIDSILIDEAKSPLIISGESNSNEELYHKCKEFIETLESSKDFNVDLKDRKINMEESLIHKAETFFNIENLYDIENAYISHYIEQALIAKYLYIKDIQYVVKNEEIVIVDTFTGRLSQGKRYSNGLHQALEVKEHLKVNFESKTLLDITYQNYFRLYDKISGMTGTAQNEATEFSLIYNLDVVTIPTNQKIKRIDNLDLVYLTQEAKLNAIVNKIKELHSKKQPILIGTTSIEKSEYLSNVLTINNLKHSVLNAKNHEQEASIIEKAGELDSITKIGRAHV